MPALESIKKLLTHTLRAAGFRIVREKNAHFESQVIQSVLRESGASVVLDVGANAGQFGDLVFGGGFTGTVISFEAIPEVHRRLVQHVARRSSTWKVAPCAAIGSQQGEIEFNIAANSVSSSALPMNQRHLAAAPQSQYIGKQLVPVERLDHLALPYLPSAGSLMIKVDTQGYEMEVLKGATGILPRTTAMQLEVSLAPLYEGAPSLIEMISFAQSIGFELFSIVPSFWDIRNGRLLQVDGFFIKGFR